MDYHLLWFNFPVNSTSFYILIFQSYNPVVAETITVWAFSSSIASTLEITFVFFSSGYLDVSVLRVSLHFWMLLLHNNGLSHSDIYGLTVICTSP